MSGFRLEKPLGAEKSYERKDKEAHRKNKGKEAHRITREPHPRPHKRRIIRLLH